MVDKIYYDDGRLWKESYPYFKTSINLLSSMEIQYIYDDYLRLSQIYNKDIITNTAYTPNSTIVTVEVVNGKKIKKEYDELNNIIKSTEFLDNNVENSVIYKYGANLKLWKTQTTAIDQTNAFETIYDYDIYGNRTKMINGDAGEFTYEYNPFGEMLCEMTKNTDLEDYYKYYTYDAFGRITQTELKRESNNRATKTNVQTTVYNYVPLLSHGELCNGVGNIKRTSLTVYPASNPSQIIDYEYDDYGRVLTKTENINGTDFISSFDYNEKGQLINETYPSNVKIENVYDNKGYLYKVMRVEGQNKNETKSELWRLISLDQFGSTLQYSLSDGKITTKKTFDDYKLPTSIKTQCYLSSIFYIQNLNYNWDDNKAILNYREDVKNYQKEEFSYDELDRLKQYDIEDKCSTPNKSKTITMNYNTDGSIDSKSDMGTYRYKENGTNALQTPIHAVKRLGDLGSSPPIQYSMPILHTIYNSFRKIKRIQEGLITADFSYGYDESRMKVVFKNNGNDNEIYTKYYLDNYERITTSGNTTKEITYITTRNGLVAAIVKQGTTERTLFVHKDYLGSVQALSEVGVNSVNIVAEFSYDPWGRARQFNDWTNLYASDASAPGFDILERSFTGQEHIIQFGIINMNARLYDSKMGSFLSPDNEVTNPENPQNYNRYSYALNNPLKYTDPSGNFPILAIMYAASLMYSATNVMVAIQNQNYQAAFLGVFSFAASAGIGSMVGGAANSILGTNLNSLESLLSNVGQGLISSFAQGMMMEGKYTGGAALQSVAFSTLGWGVDQLSRSESKNSINEWFEPTKENGVQPDQKIKYTHDPKGSEANSSHTYGDKDIYEIKYYNEDQIEKEISINMSKKLKSESDFDYLKRESPEHKQMDSKQRLDKNTVYVIDQIGYNYAEAGNYFWGASVAKMEGSIGWLGMNGGAQLYAIKNTIWIDQPWEVVAYNRAYFKYAPNISIPLPHTFR